MRTALRTIILAIREAWSPRTALFANNEVGVWYDVSDMATLFQDSAGTTPVTAVEQPVGLILDKSKGLVLGAELVTNGDFSNGTTGWSAGNNGTLSNVNNELVVTQGITAYGQANQTITAVTGKTYVFTYSVIGGTAVNFNYLVNIQGQTAASTGVKTKATFIFIASSTSVSIALAHSGNAQNSTLIFDNISVRELPGNHATQATSTKRPVLSARKNWLLATTTLSTQNVTVLAGQMVLSFYGTGTVTLSGTSTAGPLVGTGVADRVSLTFTPTAGTLTLTVSGSVTQAQLEYVA